MEYAGIWQRRGKCNSVNRPCKNVRSGDFGGFGHESAGIPVFGFRNPRAEYGTFFTIRSLNKRRLDMSPDVSPGFIYPGTFFIQARFPPCYHLRVDSHKPTGTIWPQIAVAADILVFTRRPEVSQASAPPDSEQGTPSPTLADFLDILLIRRGWPPYEGCWAIPGGGVEMDEDLEAGARRELMEETGLSPDTLVQFRSYGAPGRDPRCRVVSVVFWTIVDRGKDVPTAGDDAREARWFPLSELPELAFDHATIVGDAKSALFGGGESL
jgi:8-oxo-dGTP diphosphatase